MPGKSFIAQSVLLTLCCSIFLFNAVLGANTCQPATWQNRLALQTAQVAAPTSVAGSPSLRDNGPKVADTSVDPGQVVCRYYGTTDDTVNYYTCTEMADFYNIAVEDFFMLNPGVKDDCSNIEASTPYCVSGYIQPVISTDGFCGPSHNNATCQFTELPCCNSETWKCGNSTADCAPGTCWDGLCQGHTVYSTDGKCGTQNNNLLCAGKWGDCCSFDGACGTGNDFCGDGKCQSGNCTTPIVPPPPPPNNTTDLTPDGTCGSAHGYKCSVYFGNCCNKDNVCGSLPQDCSVDSGCQSQYGSCGNPSANTTSASSSVVARKSNLLGPASSSETNPPRLSSSAASVLLPQTKSAKTGSASSSSITEAA